VSPYTLHMAFSALEMIMGVVLLLLLIRGKELQTFWPMLFICVWQVFPFGTLLYLQHFGPGNIPAPTAYKIYYFTYWISFALEAVCSILLTYTIFSAAMRPLKGLQSLGYIIYFWAASLTLIIAAGVAIAPRTTLPVFFRLLTSQIQRGAGVIVLSLIVFVCFAVRPMGLSIRSRILGVSMGIALVSATNMVQSNFMLQARTLYSSYAIVQIAVSCIANSIWIYYFAVPEPQRKFILLPTTSPFHRWNQISELLGHDPGYVAIGGIPPEAFAAAEIEVFHRASAKMNALHDVAPSPSLPRGFVRNDGDET
jgi:hypothetical protein